jgi:hypothetical protein
LVKNSDVIKNARYNNKKNDERSLSIFDRKILRRIYGPVCKAVAEEIQQRIRGAF